ncbi:UNVERIFIED_CONTAM: hypothetical protein FKN15_042904 [Acipenser sinensis]
MSKFHPCTRFRSQLPGMGTHLQETEVQEITQEMGPRSVVASETVVTPPSSSVRALMERAFNFLQVPWKAAPEQRHSVFRPVQILIHQPFPVFPDFLEEVQSSWHRPASVPSVSLEGARGLGLEQFLPVESTVAALVQAPLVGDLSKDPACPKGQCRITEAQVTCLVKTAGLLTAYMDGIL